jgi:TetR/AcrR family transcriptional regulator
MALSERRQREKERRKLEILDAAERHFFSRRYEEVSMDDIAREVDLNKATIYLYFENKEALYAAIVLRGIAVLNKKFRESLEKKAPGIAKVFLMGQAYYRFSLECPEYLRMIHFYGTEQFSKENPCTADIGKGYGSCRLLLRDAIREGIADGTIRSDIDPFLASMYLMTAFMGILSMEDKWKLVIADEGFESDQYAQEFFRFILPAITPGGKDQTLDLRDFSAYGFVTADERVPAGKKH